MILHQTDIFHNSSRLLVRHDQVMQRLRKEIHAVLGDVESPTREQIRQMPYLDCVIRESKFRPVSLPASPNSWPVLRYNITRSTSVPTGSSEQP